MKVTNQDIDILIEANETLASKVERLEREKEKLSIDKSYWLIWRLMWLRPWIIIIPLLVSFGAGVTIQELFKPDCRSIVRLK